MTRFSSRPTSWGKEPPSSAREQTDVVVKITDDEVMVQNPKHPGGTPFCCTRDQWEVFVGRIRLGEYEV